MYKVLVVIEKAKGNYSAYCPDLPGCVATGKTHKLVEENIYEAIQIHVKGLKEDKVSLMPLQNILPLKPRTPL